MRPRALLLLPWHESRLLHALLTPLFPLAPVQALPIIIVFTWPESWLLQALGLQALLLLSWLVSRLLQALGQRALLLLTWLESSEEGQRRQRPLQDPP